MNFVHREFMNAAGRRRELHRLQQIQDGYNLKLATDAVPRTIQAPWNSIPQRRGRIVGRFFGLGATMPPDYDAYGGFFRGLGAVTPPDYGAMLMNPTASPGYVPVTQSPGFTPPSWFENITNVLKQAAPIYAQAQLLREQQKRRAAGLPPLTADQLAPTVRVQAGLDPGLMKLALYGAVGIGAALLLPKLLK